MTKRQEAQIASFRNVDLVFDRFPDEIASVPALGRSVEGFREQLAALEQAASDQAAYAPQGELKDARREALAEKVVPLAQALSARAAEEGDPSEAARLDVTMTDVLRGPEQRAVEQTDVVLGAARALGDDALTDLGLSAADVEAVEAARDAFVAVLNAPRDGIVQRRAHTAAIDEQNDALRAFARERLDRYMARFEGTPFGEEYAAARAIVDRGSRGPVLPDE